VLAISAKNMAVKLACYRVHSRSSTHEMCNNFVLSSIKKKYKDNFKLSYHLFGFISLIQN